MSGPAIGRTLLRYGYGVAVPVCITAGQGLIVEWMRGAVLFPFVAGVFLVARTARLGPAQDAAFSARGRHRPGDVARNLLTRAALAAPSTYGR